MFESLAVVGATGAVGTIILELLEQRKLPVKRSKFLSSKRSAGKVITFQGKPHTVEELTPDSFEGVDLAIGSTPDETARDFAPWAVDRGCIVIDESGYWRMDPNVPLVIPEVNPDAIHEHKGIIASPNCSTTQMVRRAEAAARRRPRAPRGGEHLSSHQRRGPGRQPRPGRRHPGQAGGQDHTSTKPSPIRSPSICIPQIGSPKHKGYTSEEMKMVYETRKMLDDDSHPDLPDLRPRAGEQLPQREHSGRDRAEDHRRRSPPSCSPPRRALVVMDDLDEKGLSDADQLRRPRRDRSSAAFARTFPARTAWRSGA